MGGAPNELKGAAGKDRAAATYMESWFTFAPTWSVGGEMALMESAALEGGDSLYPLGASFFTTWQWVGKGKG